MTINEQCRIRLKLPNGAEFEAEGSPEYVRAEREAFLAAHSHGTRGHLNTGARPGDGAAWEAQRTHAPAETSASRPLRPTRHPMESAPYSAESITRPEPDERGNSGTGPVVIRSPIWDSIVEVQRGLHLQLRAKLHGDKTDKDACLVLLAAAQKVLNLQKPTASQLARWLRASGYPIQRVDRAISDGIERGEILASGSRRARRYELTGPGRVKGFLLAQQLTQLINGE